MHKYRGVKCTKDFSLILYSDIRRFKSPNQLRNRSFPQNEENPGPADYGRSFQSSWFDHFPWLHYDEEKNAAFCFTCLKAGQSQALSTRSVSQGDAFTKVCS